jgi:hypothetical protein
MVMTTFNIPRNMRTPETEVDVLLTNISAIYSELHPDTYPDEFICTFFKDFYECEHTCGDTLAADNEKSYPVDGSGISMVKEIVALVISCAYCAQAQKAWELGEIDKAWTYIIDARFWCSSPLSRRIIRVDAHKIKELKSLKNSIAQKVWHDKYYLKQEKFVDGMYQSRAWSIKKAAVTTIIKTALEAYIEKENLPITSRTNGNLFVKKEDWYGWVYNYLPKAKQIKLDCQKILNA